MKTEILSRTIDVASNTHEGMLLRTFFALLQEGRSLNDATFRDSFHDDDYKRILRVETDGEFYIKGAELTINGFLESCRWLLRNCYVKPPYRTANGRVIIYRRSAMIQMFDRHYILTEEWSSLSGGWTSWSIIQDLWDYDEFPQRNTIVFVGL